MSEFAKRAITGAAYVTLTLGAAWAGPVTTTLLFLPVCLLAAREMYRLTARSSVPHTATYPVLAAAVVYVILALISIVPRISPLAGVTVLFLVFFGGVLETLWRHGASASKEIGSLLMVLFLVALPFGLIPALMHGGPQLFVGFMLMLWTNDTGAYLVGRSMGCTALLPRVSPKKTVEGFIGGVVLAIAVGAALGQAWPILTMMEWMACGAVVAITSTMGDLLESAFKREAGVKDSGDLLPGHGGILDRFDGFLLALPAMLITVQLIN
ncbi:MAG: phosphatidate cytidylyltransferase [Flavobacteriales bacterium]|nr:phosphatidate cytidylyltransferase [Flavobacteriales bacterium]